jgi:hypothetical protein
MQQNCEHGRSGAGYDNGAKILSRNVRGSDLPRAAAGSCRRAASGCLLR